MSETQTYRAPNGRWLPGHPQLAGDKALTSETARHVGRRPMYTPEELETAVEQYVEDRRAAEKPLTVYGLARHLGVHVDTLHSWRNGEIGRDDETKRAYSEIMTQAWYALYDGGEQAVLTGKGGRNAWLWLQNVDRKGHDGDAWVTEQRVVSHSTHEHQLVVQLPDGDAGTRLAQQLDSDVIDGEYTEE